MRLSQRSLILLFLLLLLLPAFSAPAGEVGKFTRVEGQVELLKAGQSAAVAATVDTGVEEKDVIKTGEDSRAELHFLDDTTLMAAPRSQITIESYLYDPQQGKRQAIFEVTLGLLQAVVAKVFKEKEPDFLVKTQTAIMGVRGTEFYVLVLENQENPGPAETSGLAPDFLKALEVRALETPQASVSTDVFVKSGRVSMRSSNPKIKETVLLGPLQSRRVRWNRPPGPRVNLSPKDFQRLRTSLVTGLPGVRVGPTRNPRELLERLPLRPPPRPGSRLRPGGGQSRLEGRRPTRARPLGPAAMPPKMKEKPGGPAKPLKPGEKPPPRAAKPRKPGKKPPAAAAQRPPKGKLRRPAPSQAAPKTAPAGKKPAGLKGQLKPGKKAAKPAQAPAKMKPAKTRPQTPAAKTKAPGPKKPAPPKAPQPGSQ